ncbi:von Willebrand factor A domain-containing protein 5A-like [Scomber scombrus]|uniref:von Willebrand factor A domain-containing protein 5A-like n=1 Tax=Scomber scombrus TaxID=13677 RepID=A0AAV1QGC3_SCOSC
MSPNNETVVSHNARSNRNIGQLFSRLLNPHRCSEMIGLMRAISPLNTGAVKVISCSTTQGMTAGCSLAVPAAPRKRRVDHAASRIHDAYQSKRESPSFFPALRLSPPPRRLIPQLLERVRVERLKVILLAPDWRSAPWYAELTPMVVAPPWPIPEI